MLRSELLRLRSSRMNLVIGIIVLIEATLGGLGAAFLPVLVDALIGLNEVVPNATQADQLPSGALDAFGLEHVAVQASVADLAGGFGLGVSIAGLGAIVLGALSITGEYQRGSIVSSVLAQPSRARLLGTKVAAVMIVVAAGCVPLIVIKGSVLLLGARVQGVALQIPFLDLLGLWARGILALLLLAMLGIGIGLLLQSSVRALVLLFGALLVESSLRPLSALIAGGITPVYFLPFGLLADAVRGPGLVGDTVVSVSVGIAAGVIALAVWAAAGLGFGALRFLRSDVPVLN